MERSFLNQILVSHSPHPLSKLSSGFMVLPRPPAPTVWCFPDSRPHSKLLDPWFTPTPLHCTNLFFSPIFTCVRIFCMCVGTHVCLLVKAQGGCQDSSCTTRPPYSLRRALHQAQSSPTWQLSLSSFLWGSLSLPSQGGIMGKPLCPPCIYMGSGTPNLFSQLCGKLLNH